MKYKTILMFLIVALAMNFSFAQVEITDINSAFFVKSEDLVKTRVFLGNWGEQNEGVFTVIQVTGRNYFHEYRTSPSIIKEGTESVISVYFRAPRTEGDYRLRIKAYNEDGSFEREYRFVVLEEWEDFEVVLCSEKPVLQRNDFSTVFICLANTGTKPDDYTLSVSGWDNQELESSSYRLGSSEEVSIPLRIYTDLTEKSGEYNAEVSVKGVRSGLEKTVVIPINVVGSDADDTDFLTNITAVSSITGELVKMNLTVINKGIANIYVVDVEYPEDWTGRRIEQTNLFIRSDEQKVLTLNFLANKEGVYPIKLRVSTDEGEIFLKEFRITSFGDGRVGITGAFLRVSEGNVPLYIFLVLIVLGATFVVLTYFLNRDVYYVYPKRKDKDINLELQ